MRSATRSEPSIDQRRVVVIARPDDPDADAFVEKFDGTDVDVELHRTESPDELGEVVGRAVESGVDAIAAVGGDGALNLVAEALAARESSIPVVSVRGGTVNLMAQVLGLDTIDLAVEAVLSGRTRVIDLGETEQGVFVMNASMGYDAAVIADAADHSDARFGRLRFMVEGMRRLVRDSPRHVTVGVDGADLYAGQAMSVIVFNVGNRVSDGFAVAPEASLDDGLLDVAVVRVASLRRMIVTVGRLALGREVPRDDVVRAQGERIEVAWARRVESQRDGDADGDVTRLTARVLPAALHIHHRA
ncbi:diacylglycerol/lipid kinase family protein [Ilumatobacter sp.]|uniref:diacylglycerol/lipid kinase family protein n=1 Tax=Ilumatobacter sp. TaxID=1967498 RepID=UPI003C57D026